MGEPTTVSIVINTLNRAAMLRNTLNSLFWLNFDQFEVIVVDGPSTDNSEDLIAEFAGKIKNGHCPEANLSMSRNIGISMASGGIIAFIDDDAIPEPEWLTQAVAAFDNEDVGAVGGRVFDASGYLFQYQYSTATRLGNANWQSRAATPEYCFPETYEFPYLQGTNTLFRSDVLRQVGGFDEEFDYYLDETDVCLRIVDAGYLIRQLHNAYVHHKFAPSHIRDNNRVVRNRYPIVKNKIYFSLANGNNHYTRDEIESDNKKFVAAQLADVDFHMAGGRLSLGDRTKLEEDIVRARLRAHTAAQEKRKLLLTKTKANVVTAFVRFPVLSPVDGVPMVIAMLCQDYPPNHLGGIARFTHCLAVACAQQGHQVHVLTKGEEFHRVDFEEGVWVHRLVVSQHPRWAKAVRMNVPQHIWDYSVTMLEELDRISTHRPIDLVEAPIWDCEGVAPLLSQRYSVVTSLHTTLGSSVRLHPEWKVDEAYRASFVNPMVALERYLLERSTGIQANSTGNLIEIESTYDICLNGPRVGLIRLGLPDWTKTKSAAKLRVEKKPGSQAALKLLFAGRLEHRKGIDVLLKILPCLCAEFPSLEVVIAGDDTISLDGRTSYRKAFEASSPRLVDQQVRFLGRISDEELRWEYSDCDIFVGPSRYESFGLVYVEAMICGKPVIGCNAGGTPEVVANGVNGVLVTPGSDAELLHSLRSLINDTALREKMGLEGRKRYLQLFKAERMASDCITFYRQLLNPVSSARATELELC